MIILILVKILPDFFEYFMRQLGLQPAPQLRKNWQNAPVRPHLAAGAA